jgi:tripartite-type tricarboxylate transporter receptor subunit TctC
MLKTLLAAAAAAVIAAPVQAQTWPERPVQIIVGFAPGGANDIVTRLVAQALSERLGQQFVVENKPGAGGRIAAQFVAGQKPDGYTFLNGAPGMLVLNQYLMKDTPYKVSDFDGVSLIGILPYVLVVSPELKANSVSELIELAKRKPGALNHGSTGTGPTMVQELFKEEAKINFKNIVYRGTAPALPDLARGEINFMFDLIPGHIEQIRAGKTRAIAVSAPNRTAALPNLPTVEEAGLKGFNPTNWFGFVAPKGTPQPIRDKMSKEIAAIVHEPAFKEKLAQLGADPVGSTPAEYDAFMAAEDKRWAAVIKKAGLEPK